MMNDTYIRAAEVWLPGDDGTLLEFGGGLFGNAAGFAAISRAMCFGRGEGLPGRAWDEGRPLLLPHFEGSFFRRTAAARAAGLSCALALPLFVADTLKAVLVLFCGDDPAQAGALELWHHDPRVTTDMVLTDAAYAAATQSLDPLSRETYLPRGVGLPGMAWQRGEAVFIPDLPGSARFLRAEAAGSAGVQRGLAIPCSARGTGSWVATILASPRAPLAQRVERWVADGVDGGLRRVFAFSEANGAAPADATLPAGTGAVGRALATGIPVLGDAAAAEPGAVGAAALAEARHLLLALPVIVDAAVAEVLLLYF